MAMDTLEVSEVSSNTNYSTAFPGLHMGPKGEVEVACTILDPVEVAEVAVGLTHSWMETEAPSSPTSNCCSDLIAVIQGYSWKQTSPANHSAAEIAAVEAREVSQPKEEGPS